MSLRAALQNSHHNGGQVFLIFVADPITVGLHKTAADIHGPWLARDVPESVRLRRWGGFRLRRHVYIRHAAPVGDGSSRARAYLILLTEKLGASSPSMTPGPA